MERMLAITTAMHFKGLDAKKLMEWPKAPPQEATIEGVFGMLKSVARKGNGN